MILYELQGFTFSSAIRRIVDKNYPESAAKYVLQRLKKFNLIDFGSRDCKGKSLVFTNLGRTFFWNFKRWIEIILPPVYVKTPDRHFISHSIPKCRIKLCYILGGVRKYLQKFNYSTYHETIYLKKIDSRRISDAGKSQHEAVQKFRNDIEKICLENHIIPDIYTIFHRSRFLLELYLDGKQEDASKIIEKISEEYGLPESAKNLFVSFGSFRNYYSMGIPTGEEKIVELEKELELHDPYQPSAEGIKFIPHW